MMAEMALLRFCLNLSNQTKMDHIALGHRTFVMGSIDWSASSKLFSSLQLLSLYLHPTTRESHTAYCSSPPLVFPPIPHFIVDVLELAAPHYVNAP